LITTEEHLPDAQTGKPKKDINNPGQANEIVHSSACASDGPMAAI
jgi:hypothetical protein